MRFEGILAVVTLTTALTGAPAAAHTFEHPKNVRIEVRAQHMVITVGYDVDPGRPSQLLRGLFDRNSDGEIDATEQVALLRYLERTAMLFFSMTVAGEQAQLVRKAARAYRIDRPVDSTKSLGIQLRYHAPLSRPDGGRVLEVQVEDRDKDARKHVPLEAIVAPDWSIHLASQGEWEPAVRRLSRVRLDRTRPLQLGLRTSTATVSTSVGGG